MNPRLLVFFVDGGTWQVLDPLIAAGKLPTFARLKKEGAYGVLESVVPTETSYATAAFAQGKDPAAFGLFRDQTGRIPVTSTDFPGPRIWDLLSVVGKRSLVVDFPCTWPIKPFSGVCFSGFFTPETGTDFVFPESLSSSYPEYPRGGMEIRKYLRAESEVLFAKEKEITAERLRVFRECAAAESFDFGCFYIKATDIIQHFFWNDPARLEEFWAFVDGLLAEAIRDGWSHVLIASDHGFGTAPQEAFYVNRWLADRGLLVVRAGRGGSAEAGIKALLARNRRLARLFYRLWNVLFPPRGNDRSESDMDHEVSGAIGSDIDVAASTAVAPGGVMHGKGIIFNDMLLPRGSAEREARIIEVMRGLKEVRFKDAPAFPLVARGSEVYAQVDDATPDIVFLPVPELFIEDRLGRTAFGPRMIKSRAQGHHLSSRDGMLLVHGPGILAGDHGAVPMIDLFPTILALYGVAAPAGYHGKVRRDLVTIPDTLRSVGDDTEARTLIDTLSF